MSYERAIKKAFDKKTGEIIEANEIFKNLKDAFVLRKKFHLTEIELYCLECEQKLNVSTSKYDRLHFKHEPKSEYCIFKDEKLTIQESELINDILTAKESPRHKELKNKIAQKLLDLKTINKDTITIDNKFIIRENEKRKPDVYCQYNQNGVIREIVFEIQLSQLSLKYILNRYEFYKKNGVYLIWILDNFDIHGQSQLERDIKYLTEYQNFFKLDENKNDFRLLCDYKFPFLTENYQLQTKWLQKSISLEQLKFSENCHQVYYYNFGKQYNDREKDKAIREKQILVEKKKQEEEKQQNQIIKNVNSAIHKIKNIRKSYLSYFESVINFIENFNELEIEALNSKLQIMNFIHPETQKPFLNQLIYKNENVEFIRFFFGVSKNTCRSE
jgi:competence CoiA-like predicted nuclease